MNSKRIPDAVKTPGCYAGSGGTFSKISKLQAEFSAILQVDRVYIKNQGQEHFITRCPGDSLRFPNDCPRAGESRYVWGNRGDGVFYGYVEGESSASGKG